MFCQCFVSFWTECNRCPEHMDQMHSGSLSMLLDRYKHKPVFCYVFTCSIASCSATNTPFILGWEANPSADEAKPSKFWTWICQ